LGLSWPSNDPTVSEIESIFNLIDVEINLDEVYDTISETPEIVLSQSPKDYHPPIKNLGNNYKLRGMICYYQKHYDAYFFNTLKKKNGLFLMMQRLKKLLQNGDK